MSDGLHHDGGHDGPVRGAVGPRRRRGRASTSRPTSRTTSARCTCGATTTPARWPTGSTSPATRSTTWCSALPPGGHVPPLRRVPDGLRRRRGAVRAERHHGVRRPRARRGSTGSRRARRVFFRRDTWHHAMSFGADQLRVLEFFAPPPATGTSSAYARTKDFLADPRYHDDRWDGRWPMAADERAQTARLHVMGAGDTLDSLEGDGAFVQTFASTEHLTVAKITHPTRGPLGHATARWRRRDARPARARSTSCSPTEPTPTGGAGSSCAPTTASSSPRARATSCGT